MSQVEILELWSTVIEIGNLLEGFNNKFEWSGGRNRELEDKSIEIIQSENQKEKRMK